MDVAATDHRSRGHLLSGARSRQWAWWLAWALCGLTLALAAPIAMLAIINRNTPHVWIVAGPQALAGAIVYGMIGGLLAARRSDNAIGWIFLVTGFILTVTSLAFHRAVYGLSTHPGAPGAALALWGGLALSSTVLVRIFPLLLFPGGRLHSGGSRIFAVFSGLANVAKHAEARSCLVRMSLGTALNLSIEDDGIGVGPNARAGVGLVSMRERAAELGGNCTVEPRPGSGTRIVVRLPLGKEHARDE